MVVTLLLILSVTGSPIVRVEAIRVPNLGTCAFLGDEFVTKVPKGYTGSYLCATSHNPKRGV